MSHELRTPLNAVIGFSEILKDELLGPLGTPKYVEYCGDIHDSGLHLLRIINDILDLSKLEVGQFRLREGSVDLAEVCHAALRLLQVPADAAGLTLACEVPAGLPPVRADEIRLKQIIANLLSNAVKFTPSGGRVTLSARLDGGGIVIAVSDTGIGMRAEDIPLALERFRQIDTVFGRRHEGTGLGLPLSKLLAELHGGRLEVDSRPGAGTTVRVVLPAERVIPLPARVRRV
jgi:signal transduction histidine kinase